jgi:hypothetical protein
MKTSQFILYILFFACLSACEKTITNVDLPKTDPQLVLFGFISPESDVIKIELSISKPVFGGNKNINSKVTDAIVTITNDGGQSIVIPYNDSANAYFVSSLNYPIEPNRTYTVLAQTTTKKVKASCTVPPNIIPILELSSRKVGDGENYDQPAYVISYKWNDKPNEKNYYRVISGVTLSSNMDWYYDSEICNDMYDDASYDGKTISTNCEVYPYQLNQDHQSSQKEVKIYLLNTDIHYYEYHRRRENYYGDDPFSEPFPQYSNVEGGLGVFCSYRSALQSITLN